MNARRAILVPAQADLAGQLSGRIVERHRAALPDLAGVSVLVPAAAAAAPLRRRLAAAAGGAMLSPRILTLPQFAAERGAAAAPLPAMECRLILVDALRKYRNLFPGQDVWQLAEALFALFEELSANAVTLPGDEAAFAAQLGRAYGAVPMAALSREAQIVHTLWRAFVEDTAGRSPAAAYCTALRSAFAGLDAAEPVYLAGFDTLSGGERGALDAAPAAADIEIWLHGRRSGRDGAALDALCAQLRLEPQPPPEGAAPVFLDCMLADDAAPSGGTLPGPPPALSITAAEDPEHEARCAELAVRQALLDGCREVAVVTEDRRLARRLRALLERADVELLDRAGWVLSTSAAAAVLNAWMDALEHGFQFRPLLDLLKSAFFKADAGALQALERDLVFGRGLESGLERFRHAAAGTPELAPLLERLSFAARTLPGLSRPRPALDWLGGLERSLGALGIWERWQDDAAGQRLSETFAELGAALTRRPQVVQWREFRALLDRAVERATFVPPAAEAAGTQVRLLTLEQCALLRCDAVILAGAARAQIPGAPPAEAFFNQSVRAELGLPDFARRHALGLWRLRRALEAAPRVHVTYAADKPGEPAQLSPWIEAIESRAQARGLRLRDAELARRAGTATEICTPAPLPAQRRERPAPPAAADRVPQRISATAHQQLIDCPYRFHAAACLRLYPEQAPDEDPDRSDYGLRVHRILEAFTHAVPGLPAPFGGRVDAAGRDAAGARLVEIADAVFAPDLQARALAHVWVAEFRASIPPLLDWLAARPPGEARAEVALERPFDGSHVLHGKADRVETQADGALTVVDYKTGRAPAAWEVEAGEAVQLLHYALLDERVAAVEYLPLREGQRALRVDAGLDTLRAAVGARLRRSLAAVDAGAPLPALGDAAACERCDYRGLCRKGDWHEAG
ncbi:MAG: PD-(D/E)XK nuclease family protein [Nevskia sp.]|nr:PD-(D/E)XK nuclease family protein [Nevskia sp.]